MTACANNNEGKAFSGKKAVSATLAGVLAVGMVPAAALATEGGETAEDAGIDLLAVTPQTAWENGKATAAESNTGEEIADLSDIEFVADGDAHYVVPTEFTPQESGSVDLSEGSYLFTYYKVSVAEDGSVYNETPVNNPDTITTPGTYIVKIKDYSTNYVAKEALRFTVVSADLEDATIKQVEDGNLVAPDFTYTGTAFNFVGNEGGMAIELGGKALKKDTEVSYRILDAYGIENNSPTKAGSYTLSVWGAKGSIYEGQKVEIPFTIEKLDLSDAVIVVDSTDPAAPKVTSVNGSTTLASLCDIKVTSKPSSGVLGEYECLVTPKAGTENDITGEKTASYVKYANTVGFKYQSVVGMPAQELQNVYNVDHSKGDADFDISKIKLTYDDGTQVDSSLYDVVVTDEDGNVVSSSNVTKPGKWFVTVTVDSAATDYQFGGTKTVEVNVIDGTIKTDVDVFLKYDGEVVSSIPDSYYNGENVFDSIEVVVKNSDGDVLADGKDYKVTFSQIVDGKHVETDEAVNAGKYCVEIEGLGFAFDKVQEFEFTVKPADVKDIRLAENVNAIVSPETQDGSFMAYDNGKDIPFTLEYKTAEVDEDGNAIWAALPEDAYDLKINKTDGTGWNAGDEVEALNELGNYIVTVSTAKDVKNYTVNAKENVVVTNAKKFADVPLNEWYTSYVYSASSQGYIKGYGDGIFFGPNDSIKRGDVAMIIARMAGIDLVADKVAGADLLPFETGFSDVDAYSYYAQAIKWCAETGIVTGWDGQFRPEDSVTREEFATMLYRYAEKMGDDVTADVEAELAKYTDGDQVSDFADEAVAWLSAEGIMTGDKGAMAGYMLPGNSVTRAEVAKMAVEYQPSKL